MGLYYFDYAAATPLDQRVEQVMKPFLAQQFYNPSSLYEPARRVRQAIEQARHTISTILGAKPTEVIFTAGATESINLSIKGIAAKYPKSNIIVSAIEHEAVLNSAQAAFGSRVKICPVKPNGIIDLAQLEKLIDDQTALVSVMYVNNEIGTIQPLARIASILKQAKHKIYFHSDAAQAANYLPLQVKRLGVDLLTLNGAKAYGPKQSGCLYVARGVSLAPLIHGGGQEQGLRGGTENVAQVVGLAEALKLAQSSRMNESKRLLELRNQLIKDLRLRIPKLQLNGDLNHRLPNNINITLVGHNGERLVHQLDAQGLLVATGSACSANNDKPSHVLLAIGRTVEEANASIRITLGRGTSHVSLEILAKALNGLVTS